MNEERNPPTICESLGLPRRKKFVNCQKSACCKRRSLGSGCMIFLMFLVGTCLWLIAAFMLSQRIPRWLGMSKQSTSMRWLLFVALLVAPISDELIGRWQFHRLCEREAVVTLREDWRIVKKAKVDYLERVEIAGSMIPIYLEISKYSDANTNAVFLTIPHYYTYGGILLGRVGLGLGSSTSCRPDNWIQVLSEINIDRLIKQGR